MKSRFKNATLVLILINVFIFLIQYVSGDALTSEFLLKSGDIFIRPWIILTSMFMHAGPSHILFNMYALFLFGTLVESTIGTKKFLFVYFLSGIIAALGYSFFQEVILGATGAALGASGAIMGVLGMTIMLFPNMTVLFLLFIPMSMRTAGIIFAIIDIAGIFYPTGVANTAHLAGLVVGIIYGYYFLKKHKRKVFGPRTTNVVYTVNNKAYEKGVLSQEELDKMFKK